jgi:RimJ/RimL family protein N-acetyltransferase
MRLDIGEGFFIRSFEPRDEPALPRLADNRNVWLGLRDRFPHPYTAADATAWLAAVRQQRPETHFAIASAEELAGGIGLELQADVHRLCAELGYWLGEPFWSRGIATRAVRAMTGWGFARLPIVRIHARVYSSNPGSARVLEKCGYILEGRFRQAIFKDGQLLDELIYARLKTDSSGANIR